MWGSRGARVCSSHSSKAALDVARSGVAKPESNRQLDPRARQLRCHPHRRRCTAGELAARVRWRVDRPNPGHDAADRRPDRPARLDHVGDGHDRVCELERSPAREVASPFGPIHPDVADDHDDRVAPDGRAQRLLRRTDRRALAQREAQPEVDEQQAPERGQPEALVVMVHPGRGVHRAEPIATRRRAFASNCAGRPMRRLLRGRLGLAPTIHLPPSQHPEQHRREESQDREAPARRGDDRGSRAKPGDAPADAEQD